MKRTLLSLTAALALAMTASAQMQGYGQQQPGGYGQHPGAMGQPQQTPFGQPAQPAGTQMGAQKGPQALSGKWLLASQYGVDQNPWTIQVSPNGQFQGMQGRTRMQGQFRGNTGQAQYFGIDNRTGKPNKPWPVSLQFDGGCHIQMTMRAPNGQSMQGVFHVNHQAGAPCPQ